MITRIEVTSTVSDSRAQVRKKRLFADGFKSKIKDLWITDVYTLDKSFSSDQLQTIATALANPVTQKAVVRVENSKHEARNPKQYQNTNDKNSKLLKGKLFSWVFEIGFLPGVTDNVASTTKEIIKDFLKTKFTKGESVYTSQITFLSGDLLETEVKDIANNFFNPLIQRVHIKSYPQFRKDGGMNFVVPKVLIKTKPKILEINLNVTDDELKNIGKSGIKNSDGIGRGPLALDLFYMKTIQSYFRILGRNLTDIELESLAQTWSEHCKHTIFADPIDEIKDGLFKSYIKKATDEIRKEKGKKDFCVSVFEDNSGAIEFDDKYLITHKVETHNSPSALDPFGGSITGIVGVNRDTIGFGLGAKPVANCYGFCLSDPRKDIPLYKGPNFTAKMLSSRRIVDGVIEGVNAGGNQSGIPTSAGFLYFDERYRGKPLVFVGTVGLIPRKIKGKKSYVKKARSGDLIVMIGGRVGKDGVHGATFSSETMDAGSPVSAVQIGDPITQKKLSDAIVKEARDLLLYNSITDNGAGGLSCSVAEMAKESGGCEVDLDKVPLKYVGLDPWEIWVSESQERMTLAVPAKNWKIFYDLMKRRGVEASVIGKFTNSKKCIVRFRGKIIMDIEMQFLHYGLPTKKLTTSYEPEEFSLLKIPPIKDLTHQLHRLLERLNIASYSFISQQYDHLVQGGSVLAPLQGRGRVNADATVFRPILESQRGVVLSGGLYPSYSDIDSYNMAASSIDTAIRNAVATGADPEYIALLDNFCWCSSDDPYRLGQLKRAAKACYDYALAYRTPFISGKDSMFNDFKGYDSDGKQIKISIPPTLLISSIGVVLDITKVVSLDTKNPGDLIYILGETYDELGGSEYLRMLNLKSGHVPNVDAIKNLKLYKTLYKTIEKGIIASSISIGRGGLAIALSKKSLGGMLGISVTLADLPGEQTRDDYAIFSESQGRLVVTIDPKNQNEFEKFMKGNSFALIGKVTKEQSVHIRGMNGKTIVKAGLKEMKRSYTKTFEGY